MKKQLLLNIGQGWFWPLPASLRVRLKTGSHTDISATSGYRRLTLRAWQLRLDCLSAASTQLTKRGGYVELVVGVF